MKEQAATVGSQKTSFYTKAKATTLVIAVVAVEAGAAAQDSTLILNRNLIS